MNPTLKLRPPAKAQHMINGELNGHAISKSFSQKEKRKFASCEADIKQHIHSYLKVGRALMTIQEEKLYRENYASFEEYCRDRWGMGRFYAYRQIQAAEVVDGLLPNCQQILPESESQARALVGLTPEAAQAVWNTALDEKNGRKPSARTIAQVRERITGSQKKQNEPDLESWRLQTMEALNKLKKILRSGTQDEARALALRITLLLDVGTYGPNPPQPE